MRLVHYEPGPLRAITAGPRVFVFLLEIQINGVPVEAVRHDLTEEILQGVIGYAG